MTTDVLTNWRCPACELPMSLSAKQWRCANQHSFDVAKEGYVNLLLAQHKNSKMPGDSKEMVLARSAFLSQDHYLPLAHAISDYLLKFFSSIAHNKISIFDAGCGEGYYLAKIAEYIQAKADSETASNYAYSGIDIAKPAIQKAAKRSLNNSCDKFSFAVASSYNLPVINESQNALIQIFAPSKHEEVCRVLKSGGIWISVNPASEHLFELKDIVYDNPQQHVPNTDTPQNFILLNQETLKFEVRLTTAKQRENLLMMTPFYWTISQSKKDKLLTELTNTHAHFNIKVLQKL